MSSGTRPITCAAAAGPHRQAAEERCLSGRQWRAGGHLPRLARRRQDRRKRRARSASFVTQSSIISWSTARVTLSGTPRLAGGRHPAGSRRRAEQLASVRVGAERMDVGQAVLDTGIGGSEQGQRSADREPGKANPLVVNRR